MVTRCYSFGYGHTEPLTGRKLDDTYAEITAATEEECRMIMIRLYGNQWAFDYTPEQIEAMQKAFPMRLHIRVVLNG